MKKKTYAVLCTATGRVRIGQSVRPEHRVRSYYRISPTPLVFLGTLDCGEAELHAALRRHRLHGEWFEREVYSDIAMHIELGTGEWEQVVDQLDDPFALAVTVIRLESSDMRPVQVSD